MFVRCNTGLQNRLHNQRLMSFQSPLRPNHFSPACRCIVKVCLLHPSEICLAKLHTETKFTDNQAIGCCPDLRIWIKIKSLSIYLKLFVLVFAMYSFIIILLWFRICLKWLVFPPQVKCTHCMVQNSSVELWTQFCRHLNLKDSEE